MTRRGVPYVRITAATSESRRKLVLRGSVLDPFARSDERRLALKEIAQYEADIERLLNGLSEEKHAAAIEIASLPEHLRGYGHVRERTAKATETRRAELWERFAAGRQLQLVGAA